MVVAQIKVGNSANANQNPNSAAIENSRSPSIDFQVRFAISRTETSRRSQRLLEGEIATSSQTRFSWWFRLSLTPPAVGILHLDGPSRTDLHQWMRSVAATVAPKN